MINPSVLNYKGFYSYQNKATTTAENKILKKSKSNTTLHEGFTKSAKRCYKVQCDQSLSYRSCSVEPREELHQEPRKLLEGVVQCSANYVPLSPISFLERAAQVYKDRTSVVYGSIRYTWEETYCRCLKLASSLNHLGISRGDIVATLAPNIPAMLELHFAIPMAGAVICNLNTRLDPNMISTLLQHSEAKILFVDYQLLTIAKEAINLLSSEHSEYQPPLLIIISELSSQSHLTLDHKYKYNKYENLVEGGFTEFNIVRPYNESDPISLNYTSGTTSNPKGVVYSHRGAYLNALACVFMHGMGEMPTYLWTVPMFHCGGWCMSWGVAMVGGTNICLRRCDPEKIFDNIMQHKVTHMGGAPTVLNMIVNSMVANQKRLPWKVEIMTAGAPPPPTIVSKIEELGFRVSHGYGLTETYGIGTWCLWKPEWDFLPAKEKGKLKVRQGVRHFGVEEVDVKDPVTMKSVKCDGKEIGEIMFRGNTVMSGYFKDVRATEVAFAGGWFRSGDLGIKQEDGYIEVKDRVKDIVISGGENISTIEVESVIYRHEAVLEVAVAGRPDDHWGQTPCAFVKLKEGFHVDAQEIINYCRDNMSHFMAPKTVIFQDLPRNPTGKIEKFVLREKAKSLGSLPRQQVQPKVVETHVTQATQSYPKSLNNVDRNKLQE